MPSKPSSAPRWLNDTTEGYATTYAEPTEGKKTAGWATAAKQQAQFMNWFMRRVYLWLAWIDSLITSEGIVKHGERTIHLPGTAGKGLHEETLGSGWRTDFYHMRCEAADAVELIVPISMVKGDRLKKVVGIVRGDLTYEITMKVWIKNGSSDETPGSGVILLGTSDPSLHITDALQALTVAGLTTTIGAEEFLTVTFHPENPGQFSVYGIEVTYDRVA